MKEELFELETRIVEAFRDESFVKRLSTAETPEEAQAALQEKGIEMNMDDVRRLPDELKRMRGNGDELTEDELEDVAGGMTYPVIRVVVSAAVLRAVGTACKHIRGW